MNTYSFIILSVIVAVSAAETWTGPFAENKIGQLVEDTPEVAAAKRQHVEAYNQIRKLLPELPQEDPEEYEEEIVPQIQQQIHHHVPQPVIPQRHVTPEIEPSVTQPRWTGPLADHVLGQRVQETPEVAEARKLHESAYSKIRAILPELHEDDDRLPVAPPQKPLFPVDPQQPKAPLAPSGETLEVEEARKEHLRIVKETAALLQELNAAYTTTPRPVRPLNPLHPMQIADYRSTGPEELARAYAAILNH